MCPRQDETLLQNAMQVDEGLREMLETLPPIMRKNYEFELAFDPSDRASFYTLATGKFYQNI